MSFLSLSSKSNNKAMAGRDLLRLAMSGQIGGDDSTPKVMAAPGVGVRIHGMLDKPASGFFGGEDWQGRYFVLRTDFVLEYYNEPPKGVQPPHWHHGVAAYESVVGHLGQARGVYPLEKLSFREARAEGPRLHIYVSQDVRFGGKDCRELQLRVSAEDRAKGVPHATGLIKHWAQAINEVAGQVQRARMRGEQPQLGGLDGSSPGGRFGGGQTPQQPWGSMSPQPQWGSQPPQQWGSQSPQQQWGSQSPQQQWGSQSPQQQAGPQPQQCGSKSPMDSRYPGEFGYESPGRAPPPVPRDASRNSWNAGPAAPTSSRASQISSSPHAMAPQNSVDSRQSGQSEGDARRMQELEEKNALLEQRLAELERRQGSPAAGFSQNGGLPPLPTGASQPRYERSPTLEAIQRQQFRGQEAFHAPTASSPFRSSAAY